MCRDAIKQSFNAVTKNWLFNPNKKQDSLFYQKQFKAGSKTVRRTLTFHLRMKLKTKIISTENLLGAKKKLQKIGTFFVSKANLSSAKAQPFIGQPHHDSVRRTFNFYPHHFFFFNFICRTRSNQKPTTATTTFTVSTH